MGELLRVIFATILIAQAYTAPSPDFVVTTKAPSTQAPSVTSGKESEKESQPIPDERILKIYEMSVLANVSNRFVHAQVSSYVKNFADTAKEATFSVVLPNTAYIAGFVLEMDGKKYTAYVKEKEEAKNIYDEVCLYL